MRGGGLYPEEVIIDRDTRQKEQASKYQLVPLRNKLNKQKTKGTSQLSNSLYL